MTTRAACSRVGAAFAATVSLGGVCALGGAQEITARETPAPSRVPAVLRSGPVAGGTTTGGLGVVCDLVGGGGGCQLPDQMPHNGVTGATSDANAGFAVAENFSPAVTGQITEVCWWGMYIDFGSPNVDCAPGPGSAFRITYFTDSPDIPHSVPGAAFAGPFSVTATKAPTGNFIGSIPAAEFEFTATHPAVNVTAGECYWVRIQDASSDPQCLFLWVTAPPGDGWAAQDLNNDGVFDPASELNEFDQAFCLNIALAAPDACIPAACGAPGAGPCDQENPGAGCDDQACCNVVCESDPFCCDEINGNWDASCVQAAYGANGLCLLPACGAVGTGGCFDADGTPFCDDTCGGEPCSGCCATVCSFDPFCCTTSWDGFCVGEAMAVCLACGPGDVPANDDCVNATRIGLGTSNVSNTCASVECVIDPECDQPDHAGCNDGFSSGLGLDVWYVHTAQFSGLLSIIPDPDPGWDTQLTVYLGADCGALSDPPLACAGVNLGTNVDVVQGIDYLIRLGAAYTGPSGTGTLTLAAVPAVCINGTGDCIAPHANPGCQDTDCCTAVCFADPSCCNTGWDQACADIAAAACAPQPCGPMDVSAATVVEPEVCGMDANGGCNSAPPIFTDIAPGDIIHGTAWASAGTRDTDWYLLSNADLDAADADNDGMVDVHYGIAGELPVVSFVVIDPAGDCSGDEVVIGSTGYGQNCVQVAAGVATVTINQADRVIVFAGTGNEDGGGIFDGFPCPPNPGGTFGSNYLLCVNVVEDAAPEPGPCPPSECPWDSAQPGDPPPGPGTPDGTVGINDLIHLLANWGACPPGPCPWDSAQPGDPPPGPGTPDGTVGINDLIHLLANWGACPK